MYELDDYLAMIRDEVRTPAYLAAMAAVIRPGDTVLDLGTGFGFFSVHACRLGAAHVWAIEPNDAVGLGRVLAAANGCADRISFMQGMSQRVELPRRADVLVEDLRGISPLDGTRLIALADAQRRLLVPDARRVPVADDLRIAPSELPSDLSHRDLPTARSRDGIALDPVLAVARQAVLRTHGGPESLLGAPATWARLDYAQLPDSDVTGSANWRVERAGRFAGFVSWFHATLAPGIGFETGPSQPRTVYDRGFLPLREPLEVTIGDEIAVRVRTKSDGNEYVWAWDTRIGRADGSVVECRDSNLATRAISAARRAHRAADHRPERTAEVTRMETLLRAVDGEASLAAIAGRVRAAHPDAFASEAAALRWAGERLARLGEEPAP